MEARATSFESHIFSVGRSVVGEAVMAARVHENDLEVRNLRRRNWSRVKVNEYWSGSVPGFRVGSRVEQ